MSLTLSITNIDQLENGEPLRLVLDRHGAVVGRSPHADWSLPDPRAGISGTHCVVEYRDGVYSLIDKSLNGTFLNGSRSRLEGSHELAEGDEIHIGHYRILASFNEDALARTKPEPPPPPPPAWDPPPRPAPGTWDLPEGDTPRRWAWGAEPGGVRAPLDAAPNQWVGPGADNTGRGALSQHWTPPAVTPPPAVVDVWDRLAGSHDVDWGRGGFATYGGEPAPSPPAPPPGADDEAWTTFLTATGVQPSDLKATTPHDAAAAAGMLLRRLIAGLVVMLEARARAKAELGASGTRLEFDGNNPLKMARQPEQALIQLLSPRARGFMATETAVEDAFRDLQAHQIATLSAMQHALRVTLDRFSPASIRDRARPHGFLASLFASAREAQLWRVYERDFEGVAQGSDEAFMDVFAKEFREAYERAAAEMKRRG